MVRVILPAQILSFTCKVIQGEPVFHICYLLNAISFEQFLAACGSMEILSVVQEPHIILWNTGYAL